LFAAPPIADAHFSSRRLEIETLKDRLVPSAITRIWTGADGNGN
jgi:hypothetical protein